MRSIVAYLAVISAANSFAAGIPCSQLAYAELKDMSKKELTENYCESIRMIGVNRQYRQLAVEAGNLPEIKAVTESSVSCGAAADDASRLLRRKFKVEKPAC